MNEPILMGSEEFKNSSARGWRLAWATLHISLSGQEITTLS